VADDPLYGPKRDAYSALVALFAGYGLGTLTGQILRMVQEGLSADTISVELQETKEWKTRFVGNEKRRAKGLPVLSPAEYLATEAAYRQVYRQFGLPTGFYDDPDDFARAMEADMSAMELQARVQARKQVVTSGENTGVLSYFKDNFGLTDGDMLAYWVDPDRALPLLQQQVAASEVGAAAQRTGWGGLDKAAALRLADLGITPDQAAQGFGEAAGLAELTQQLPGTAGDDTVTRGDLIGATLEQNAVAKERVLRSQETRLAAGKGGGRYAEDKEGLAGLRQANT